MTIVRKKHSKGLKFQAALAMIKGEKTIAELSSEFKVHQGVFLPPDVILQKGNK